MKIGPLFAALLTFSFHFTTARAKEITGKWEMEFSTANGQEKYLYELKVEGDKVTGKSAGRVGDERPEAELKEGKIKGEAFSWVEYLKDVDGKEIKVATTGKIQGDALVLVRSPSDADPVKATLTRVKPPSALAKSITGKWTVEFDSPVGSQKYRYELRVEGDRISGQCVGEAGEEKRETKIATGDIRGDEVSWVEILDFLGTPTRIETDGKIENADQIRAMRRFGSYGLYEITLKRVKEN